jgi:hypothetical protein
MPSSFIVSIVTWVVYFGLTVGVILFDGKLQREKATREGRVDFMDRSPWGYIAFGLICGPLPLVFYFGATRKNAMGWLLGIGAAVGVYVATVVVAVILQVALRAV